LRSWRRMNMRSRGKRNGQDRLRGPTGRSGPKIRHTSQMANESTANNQTAPKAGHRSFGKLVFLTTSLGRMNNSLRIFGLPFLLLPALALAQVRLVPVDQAASVPDFLSFRAQLQVAIAKRDVDAVVSVLSKDVQLSFGGDAGVKDFKRMWRPRAPDTELWEKMAAVLSLGGTFSSDGTFTAPYVFTEWPQEKDSLTHVAAIGTGIRVRGAASIASPIIASLDYSIVEVVESPATDSKWVQIKIGPGRAGFVDSRYVRSPIDYRINFAKLDGRWQIVFFLAGD
jgi:hypothetical protein